MTISRSTLQSDSLCHGRLARPCLQSRKEHGRASRPWHSAVPGLVLSAVLGFTSFVARASEPSLSPSALSTPGQISLDQIALKPGTTLELTGQWLFKPGYDVQKDEHPESSANDASYLTSPVPQLLNRIQWWLDDSEDFKKWETDRLKNLGFDTERASDGWYRMWVNAPKLDADRHLWVEFDGVAMRCDTYVNGAKLGHHDGMFSRFRYDLTPHLHPGKNLLAVHVAMEGIPDTDAKLGEAVTVNLSAAKVISMSKGMFGPLSPKKSNRDYDLYGIWQPVKLVVRGDGHIDDVFFNPSLTGAKIDVEVNAAGGTRVHAVVTDPATGQKLAETQSGTSNDPTTTLTIKDVHPKLWTPAEPNLYRLDVTLESDDGTTVLDKWSRNVGFRTFEAKGNQLLLNGHPYWLRGANQLPYGKNPFSPELARKLIQLLHDNNVRFTRTHATPWNEAWLDAADSIGLAVSVEGIRPWAFAGKSDPPLLPPPAIFQHWLMENADVVKRCRNHPSVVIFTVGNEMLLRDAKSVEKWSLLSQVVKQTRTLAAGLPVVCSSDYTRDPEFYNSTLKPKGFDDGDLDDMHRYFGWYADSAFVMDFKFDKELANNKGARPLIGQEFATGYPDLDTGLPVWRYTRDLATPLAWVGRWSYPPNSPDTFLTHHAIVTQREAEKLRYQSHDKTAGFSLFSAECWFHHSYDPATVKPYPTLAAAKEFWSPIGVALETSQRRFYIGDEIATNVYVTNDDEHFRDLTDLTVSVGDTFSGREAINGGVGSKIDKLPYYQTAKVPVRFRVTDRSNRRAPIHLAVYLQGKDVDQQLTRYAVELFPKFDLPSTDSVVRGEADLSAGSALRKKIEQGATVILTSPAKSLLKYFPTEILDAKPGECEFADPSPMLGTPLGTDLQPMDIKWWARKDDPRCFVASQSHRLKQGGHARSLLDYVPPHSYISADKLPDQFRTVLFEIPLGKGRLWVCDLDFDASRGVDPAADFMLRNLIAAAADPHSTDNLPHLPTHQELVEKVARPPQ